MLGVGAIAQLAIAQFPNQGEFGPAWRRALAQEVPGALLNRQVPSDDELAIILAMSI